MLSGEDETVELLTEIGERAVQALEAEAAAHVAAFPEVAAALWRLARRVERVGYAGALTRFGHA